MSGTTYHLCLSIRGFMENAKFPRDYKIFQHDDGHEMTPTEAREFLTEQQRNGHRVIPAAKCDNFYFQTGCKGHPEELIVKNSDVRLTPAALEAAAAGNVDNFIAASTPGGIEAQEKTGQAMFVRAQSLPKEMTGCTRADFERLGFVFGDDIDELFVTVQLPAGWRKDATDHSMHSNLLDNKGRRRASIFYKAAFYDRRADIHLTRRYDVTMAPTDANGGPVPWEKAQYLAMTVTDCGKEIHRTGVYERGAYKADQQLREQALAWLDEHFPNWKNTMAYWD
jgi:hypothetical protein